MIKKRSSKPAAKGRVKARTIPAKSRKDSEEGYRSLIESSPDAVAVHQKGVYVDVNSAGARLFGATYPDQVIGRRVLDLVHPEYRQVVADGIQTLEQSKEPSLSQAIKVLRLDGTIIDVEGGSSLVSFNGKPAIQVILRDITGRKQREEQLRRALSESCRREVEISAFLKASRAVLEQRDFKSAAEAIFRVCKNLTGATSGYISLLSPDEKENEAVFLDPGEDSCQVDPNLPMPIRGIRGEAYRLGQVVCENQFPQSEYTKFLPKGHSPLENVLMAPLKLNGKVVGLLGLSNKPGGFNHEDIRLASAFGDIAAVALVQKRVDEKLRLSDERFRIALQGSPITVFNQDDKLRYTWVYNPAFGLASGAMLAKSDEEIFPPEDAARFTAIKRRALETGKATREETWIDHGGRRHFFDLTVEPLPGGEGQIVGVTCAAIDITERKRLEKEAERLASFPRLNPNPVMEIGAGGELLFANQAAADVIREAAAGDARIFFPQDMDKILAALDEGKEEALYREVKVNDRLFGENIYLTPQFKTIRIFANDITERRGAEEALRKNKEKFELLAETAGRLLASDDPQRAVNDLCRRVMEHLDCQACFHYMADPDQKGLCLTAWAGIPEETAREIKWLPYGTAVCGSVARDGLPIVAEDILRLPDSQTDLVRSFGIQAYACHPLMAQGKVIGMLSFGTKTRAAFGAGELDLMKAVADHVAAAMERNRLLQMARLRADELDAVFSAMNEPVIVYNAEGVPVKVNAAGRAYGLDDRPEELKKLGDPNVLIRMLSVRHPDGRGLTPDELPSRRALGGEKVAGENFLLRTRDGRDVDIQVSASPIVTAGKITGAVAVWNDVTERERWFHELRKAKEELELRVQERTAALREAKTLLENTLASLTDAVFVIDPRTRTISSCNAAAERIFGYRIEEMIGRNTQFIHVSPALYEEFGKKLFADLNEKGVFHSEFLLRRKNGSVFFTENTVTQILDEAGGRRGVVSVVRDITQRKEAEQALWKANELLERVFSSIDLLIAYMDKDCNFIRVNRAYAAADGRTPEFYVGKNHFTLFPHAENERIFRKVVETGEPYIVFEKAFEYAEHPERGLTYWDWSLHPVKEADGQVSGLVLSLINVTEQVKLQQHNRKAEKMEALGTLAGGIAHDFNNILMSMVVNTELALMDTPEGTSAQQVLRDVLKAAQVGQALVKQIIAYSRPSEQEWWHPVAITPVVKETLKLIAPSVPGNIEIRTNVEGSVRMAKVNPAQIHQVLLNLCNNAVYAMRETGGILEVSLTDVEAGAEKASLPLDLRPGPYLRLTVRDTGHGMERAVQEKIFDPFFTTKRPGEGTGMGLAVVQGIVKGYKGAVFVESQPGQGATFQVYFPSTPAHEVAPSPAVKVSSGKNEGLLLVDDDESVLRGLKTALERIGYRVTATTRSPEALEIFRAHPQDFDLVLTDQSMPDRTGLELAGEMLKIRPDIPVILFTGFSEGVGEKEAKEAGIREFILKPIHTAEIAEVIRKVLDKK